MERRDTTILQTENIAFILKQGSKTLKMNILLTQWAGVIEL